MTNVKSYFKKSAITFKQAEIVTFLKEMEEDSCTKREGKCFT